jgi:hypothetical protein
VQNRQVQSTMFVIMSSECPVVRAVHPDLGLRPQFQRVLPWHQGLPLHWNCPSFSRGIFCLVSCPANTAKKEICTAAFGLLVCDHGFFLVSLGYIPWGTLLSQVIKPCQTLLRQSTPKTGKTKEQKERTHVQARKQKWSTRSTSKRGEKSHIVDPTIVRSMLKNKRGGTLEKHLA